MKQFCLLAALAAGTAFAQAPGRADPADPRVPAPAPAYRSAFEDYRRLEPGQRANWRDANEEAARIGGHIGVLREQMSRSKPTPEDRK